MWTGCTYLDQLLYQLSSDRPLELISYTIEHLSVPSLTLVRAELKAVLEAVQPISYKVATWSAMYCCLEQSAELKTNLQVLTC